MRIAINGFGRIGRNFLRTIMSDKEAQKKLDVVLINVGPADVAKVAHMFTYDTVMGRFKGDVSCDSNRLTIDDHSIELITITDPKKLNWKSYNIDWVVDASGRYATQELSKLHIDAGAGHVLITAPCKGVVATIVPGVNDDQYNPDRDRVVSLASCTTNAIMPTLKVLHDAFTIKQGFMTTVHAYTNSQVLIDVESDDLRRSRAAALNIIPTSTGASRMIDQVMPALKGLILSTAIRVPVATVSLIDFVVHTQKELSVDILNHAFECASKADLKGILAISNEPLVSSDYIGSNYSVTIDAALTQASGNMAKVFGWYDNEWGYSMRLKDFLLSLS